MSARKTKGIGLLSGGLDSILAVKILQEQDLDLLGITFVTPFFGPEAGLKVGEVTGIPVRALDIGQKHLEMLRRPQYGYGSQMNPCIDCHALMIQEAGQIMEKEGGDFLFTGEVLGQRPMSQRRDALRSVENLAGFPGRVLRPLSAKLLPPTLAEQEGLVDRDRLLDIHGRGRKRQALLAEHYGIRDYPQPGGGCLLTKEGFANKLKQLLLYHRTPGLRELELLKWGRLFRLPTGSIYLVGRHQLDNEKLEAGFDERDILFQIPHYRGPVGLMIAPADSDADKDSPLAGRIVASYSDIPDRKKVEVKWKRRGETGNFCVTKEDREYFRQYLI